MATMVRVLERGRWPYEITIKRGTSRTKEQCALFGSLNEEKTDVWLLPDPKLLQCLKHCGKGNPFCSDVNGWGPYTIGN